MTPSFSVILKFLMRYANAIRSSCVEGLGVIYAYKWGLDVGEDNVTGDTKTNEHIQLAPLSASNTPPTTPNGEP